MKKRHKRPAGSGEKNLEYIRHMTPEMWELAMWDQRDKYTARDFKEMSDLFRRLPQELWAEFEQEALKHEVQVKRKDQELLRAIKAAHSKGVNCYLGF